TNRLPFCSGSSENAPSPRTLNTTVGPPAEGAEPMAAMPSKPASGTSHERFGNDVTVTMHAHQTMNTRLSEKTRQALAFEFDQVGRRTRQLADANRPYQEWLRGALVETRAAQRVGDFLCDE